MFAFMVVSVILGLLAGMVVALVLVLIIFSNRVGERLEQAEVKIEAAEGIADIEEYLKSCPPA